MSEQRVLVIAPQWLGDAVMSHALIQLLAAESNVDVVCASWLIPVYRRMPFVNKVIGIDVKHGKFPLKLYWQTAKAIKGQYDQCFVIPRKLKSALIPWLANIPKRTAYRGESRYFLINDCVFPNKNQKLWVERVCGLYDSDLLIEDIPNPILNVDSENQNNWKAQLNSVKPLVALMPGASYGLSKQWPTKNFTQLAEKLSAKYTVIVVGGHQEVEIAKTIQSGNDAIVNLCGKTSLEDTIDLLALCEFAVSNDSGLMHIAAAVGCFVKALYGSSSPDYTPPLTDKKQIYSDPLSCKPCFKRTCEFGHYNCWQDMSVERVLEKP